MQHGDVGAHDTSQQPPCAALAAIADELAHEQRPETLALEVGAHQHRELRGNIVRICAGASDTQNFLCPGAVAANSNESHLTVVVNLGIGFVNVPSMIPMTLVHSPLAILTGCSWMRVSG